MASQYDRLFNTNYVSQYVPLPLEFIAKAGAMKQGEYDKTEAERIELLGKQFNRLNQDSQTANLAKQELDRKVEDFAGRDLTDPQVKAEWYKTKREIANRYNPGGDIYALQSNYALAQKDIEEKQKQVDMFLKSKGTEGISPEMAELELANSNKNYQGIGQKDSNGNYKSYNSGKPTLFRNIDDEAMKLAKETPIHKWAFENGYKKSKNGETWEKNGGTGEVITKEQIFNKIMAPLMNDQLNKDYVNRIEDLRGNLEQDNLNGSLGFDANGNQVIYNPNNKQTAIESRKFNTFQQAARNAAKYWERDNTLTASADSKFYPGSESESSQKIKDKLIIFNEGEAVKLTPDDIKKSRESFLTKQADYNKKKNELVGIEKTYGKNSRDYETKSKELRNSEIDMNNTKSFIDNIDIGMQKTTHKVDYDKHYNEYINNAKKNNQEIVSKDVYINLSKNFRTYTDAFTLSQNKPDVTKNPLYSVDLYNSIGFVANEYSTSQAKYLKETEKAYTVQPISGEPTSTTGQENKLLTDSFKNSTTNYTMIGTGEQTQAVLDAKYPNRDKSKDDVRVTHKTIGGQPVQYLTIEDADGVKHSEYISPKVGGLASMKTVAKSILRSQEPYSEEWYKGKEMLINAMYLPSIQQAKLDGGGIKTIVLSDGNEIGARKIEDVDNGISKYELLYPSTHVKGNEPILDENNKPIQAGSEEELAEYIFNIKNK